MCTIALIVDLVGQSDRVIDRSPSLVIAANRDEMYARPTRPPEPLGDGVVGGVDVQSGGTWLAISGARAPSDRRGRFAAVTNQRAMAPAPASAKSRGWAVRDLITAQDMDGYVRGLDATQYASMNLVWAEPGRAPRIAYLRHDDGAKRIIELPRGVHVLCNAELDVPFPRGARLRAGIEAALARGEDWPALAGTLGTLLADHTRLAPADVPPSELPLEISRELTAACIHTPIYGTRSSTIAAFGPNGVIDYRFTEGPPCTSAFRSGLELLQ